MTPRTPSATLVVDANILVSAVFSPLRTGALLRQIAAARALATSVEVEREVRGRASDPRLTNPRNEGSLTAALALVPRVAFARYAAFLPVAALALRDAPASANGSEADAHLLALAWATDSDLWTHDRDFAGTGWPTWSSRNLLAVLTQPADL